MHRPSASRRDATAGRENSGVFSLDADAAGAAAEARADGDWALRAERTGTEVDFLDAKVREIEERLQELRPLIDEYRKLEAAAAALDQIEAPGRRGRVARNGRRTGGRPRGGATRAAQAVELVRARPGITIPELAQHMGIKPNYLYRILPQLEEEGKVRREGKAWVPA